VVRFSSLSFASFLLLGFLAADVEILLPGIIGGGERMGQPLKTKTLQGKGMTGIGNKVTSLLNPGL
jgi:hypothetical protein